jgi:hypothetical protein
MRTEQNKSPPRHTPEPWQYDPETGLVHGLDQTLICDMCTDPDSAETAEHHANGFLVDSAPELLEGAQAAVVAFDNLSPLLPDYFLKTDCHRLSMAIEALRDAIAMTQRGQR